MALAQAASAVAGGRGGGLGGAALAALPPAPSQHAGSYPRMTQQAQAQELPGFAFSAPTGRVLPWERELFKRESERLP